MLTLSGYDSSAGDALKIEVKYIDDTKVTDSSSVDVTSALVSAGILTGGYKPTPPGPGGDSTLDVLFGETFVDVALCALDTPLYSSSDKEAI